MNWPGPAPPRSVIIVLLFEIMLDITFENNCGIVFEIEFTVSPVAQTCPDLPSLAANNLCARMSGQLTCLDLPRLV